MTSFVTIETLWCKRVWLRVNFESKSEFNPQTVSKVLQISTHPICLIGNELNIFWCNLFSLALANYSIRSLINWRRIWISCSQAWIHLFWTRNFSGELTFHFLLPFRLRCRHRAPDLCRASTTWRPPTTLRPVPPSTRRSPSRKREIRPINFLFLRFQTFSLAFPRFKLFNLRSDAPWILLVRIYAVYTREIEKNMEDVPNSWLMKTRTYLHFSALIFHASSIQSYCCPTSVLINPVSHPGSYATFMHGGI